MENIHIKYKVFAYITHQHNLLVFRHPLAPKAGIQVPAGTLKAGEAPEEGVLREAFEETGLSELMLVEFLGKQIRDMADFGRAEIHQRFFYHLCYAGEPPATWLHEELYPDNGPTIQPIIFEFFWISLPNEIPPLIADHGWMLPRLIERLGFAAQ